VQFPQGDESLRSKAARTPLNANNLEIFIMIKKLVEMVGIALTATTLLAGAMLMTLSACEPQGPAENAGEKVDNAAEKAGEKVDDAVGKAGDSIHDATKPDNN
jgi:hypothetical protein